MPFKDKASRCLSQLRRWAKEKHSITVVIDTGQEDRYLSEERLIVINGSSKRENQVYSLLHELGHAMNNTPGSTEYGRRFRTLNEAAMKDRQYKTYAYRVQVIEEEIASWRNGFDLSQRLKLNINQDEYEKYAAKYIMSYIDWASERDWEYEL